MSKNEIRNSIATFAKGQKGWNIYIGLSNTTPHMANVSKSAAIQFVTDYNAKLAESLRADGSI